MKVNRLRFLLSLSIGGIVGVFVKVLDFGRLIMLAIMLGIMGGVINRLITLIYNSEKNQNCFQIIILYQYVLR